MIAPIDKIIKRRVVSWVGFSLSFIGYWGMFFSLIIYSQSMEKTTLRSLFLLMVITGSIFTLTACGPEKAEVEEPKESVKVEQSEKDEDESKEEKDDKNVVPKVEVKPVDTSAKADVKVTTKYIDGTYTKVGSYQSPGGSETVTVTVNVKDEMVQSVSVVKGTDNETSERFQGLFIDGIGAEVVGKKLSEVKVSVVNGSSLTGEGFNKAIAEIQASAQK